VSFHVASPILFQSCGYVVISSYSLVTMNLKLKTIHLLCPLFILIWKWYWKGIRRWKKWPNRLDLSVGDSQQDQSNSKENRLIARVRSHYTGNFGSSISDYHYLHNRICMVRSSCSLVKVVHDLGWNRLRQVGFYLLPDNSELSLLLLLYERIKQ